MCHAFRGARSWSWASSSSWASSLRRSLSPHPRKLVCMEETCGLWRGEEVKGSTAHFVKDAHDTSLLSTRLWRLIGTLQVCRLVGVPRSACGILVHTTLLTCGLGHLTTEHQLYIMVDTNNWRFSLTADEAGRSLGWGESREPSLICVEPHVVF